MLYTLYQYELFGANLNRWGHAGRLHGLDHWPYRPEQAQRYGSHRQ